MAGRMRLLRTQAPRYQVTAETQSARVAAEFAAKSLDLPPRAAFYRWLVEEKRMGEGAKRKGSE